MAMLLRSRRCDGVRLHFWVNVWLFQNTWRINSALAFSLLFQGVIHMILDLRDPDIGRVLALRGVSVRATDS